MALQMQPLALTSMVLLASLAEIGYGALLVYEPFDYPAGTVLDGTAATGQNLTGTYAAMNPGLPSPFVIVADSPGLDYGNLAGVPGAIGNRISELRGTTSAGVTVTVEENVPILPGQAVFWSALFTFDDSENGNHLANVTFTNDENGDELSFGEVTVGVRAIRVNANTGATGMLIGAGEDGSFVSGQTLLLIGRYVNSAAAGGDRLDLIGYDTADAIKLPANFDPADANALFAYDLAGLDIDFETITSVTFQIRADDNNFIDELRIGRTYGDVIPEPTARALFVFAWSVVAVMRGKRHATN
jgi:hypothetical protein